MAIGSIPGGLAPVAESNVLQSFSDATAGRSLQLFYALAMKTSAGVTYALTRDGGVSSPEFATIPVASSPLAYDFDVTINKSTLVGGLGYLDIKTKQVNAGSVSATVGLYHWDGVSETLITGAVVGPSLVATGEQTIKMPLSVSKQNFRVGNSLRLKVTMTIVGAGVTGYLYHDPQTAGDELKLWLPVVNLE